uniref:Uncharacterized protein n=2 Tax=viral metagenome TaxID=1070528 RepID=A0A6M3L4A9_9ZZZZ
MERISTQTGGWYIKIFKRKVWGGSKMKRKIKMSKFDKIAMWLGTLVAILLTLGYVLKASGYWKGF